MHRIIKRIPNFDSTTNNSDSCLLLSLRKADLDLPDVFLLVWIHD